MPTFGRWRRESWLIQTKRWFAAKNKVTKRSRFGKHFIDFISLVQRIHVETFRLASPPLVAKRGGTSMLVWMSYKDTGSAVITVCPAFCKSFKHTREIPDPSRSHLHHCESLVAIACQCLNLLILKGGVLAQCLLFSSRTSTKFKIFGRHLRTSFPRAVSLKCSWARRHTTARSDSRCSMESLSTLSRCQSMAPSVFDRENFAHDRISSSEQGPTQTHLSCFKVYAAL